jgi:cell division protein FtsW
VSDTIRPIRPTRQPRPTGPARSAGKATSTTRKTSSTTRKKPATTSGTSRKRPSTTKGRRLAGKPVGRRSPTFVLLLALVVVLTLIGLVMVLSASSVTALYEYGSSWYHFKRQLIWVSIGSVAMVIVMRVDYHRWRRYTTALVLGSGLLMVLVMVPGLGVNVNGSSRWLGYGFARIQPSEFAKLAVLLFVADLLARRFDKVDNWRVTLKPVLVVFGVFAVMLMLQPNLGTTIILASIVFVMLFVSGVPIKPLVLTFTVGGVFASMAAIFEPYRRRRLLGFLNPWKDSQNTGYQTIQSQVGIARGGIAGSGLGQSRAKWGFLPFAHTDFIFAIIAEELGLIGAVLVVALFVALGVAGIRTALRAPDHYGMLLATGITSWILIQAFVNVGAVVGVLPITGVPLPFVSFGGSSLVVTMASVGLLLNVARQAR